MILFSLIRGFRGLIAPITPVNGNKHDKWQHPDVEDSRPQLRLSGGYGSTN